MPLPDQIERAWREAANEERAIRSAFVVCPEALDLEQDGLRLPVLRVRHLAKLDAIQSPWLGHGDGLKPTDVIHAWLILHDADYTTGTSWLRRSKLARQCAARLLTAAQLIAAAIEQGLQDLPPAPSETQYGTMHASPVACIIDSLAAEYHWSLETILDLPAATACQFLRCILRRKHDLPLGNPSDRILTNFLDGTERRNGRHQDCR